MNDMGPMQEKTDKKITQEHSIEAVGRREIVVKGVREVLSFDSENVRLVTVCGVLNLEGSELRVHVLNTKEGVVAVTGTLTGVLYEDDPSKDTPPTRKERKGGRLGRLFG